MATVLIGPGMFIYYTIGNLGARIAGEGRYGSNYQSISYYPSAALLSTIGLLLFYFVVFGVFGSQLRQKQRINYSEFQWTPWQALASLLLSLLLLGYLSLRYEFINGYFLNVTDTIDRFLAASQYMFISLATFISVSVLIKSRSVESRAFSLVILGCLVLLALGLRSRTSVILLLFAATLCWITLEPRKVLRILLIGIIPGFTIFALGSVVKVASTRGETTSISDNLSVLTDFQWASLSTVFEISFGLDYQYRLAGLEMPAALVASLENNYSPLYGQAMLSGTFGVLPNFLRSDTLLTERIAVLNHYRGSYLRYGDSIGIPLTSGLADWGIVLSPLIYVVIALFCIGLWHFTQMNARLFLACLAISIGPGNTVGLIGDLFWDTFMTSIKAIGFCFIVLVILGPMLLPRVRSAGNSN